VLTEDEQKKFEDIGDILQGKSHIALLQARITEVLAENNLINPGILDAIASADHGDGIERYKFSGGHLIIRRNDLHEIEHIEREDGADLSNEQIAGIVMQNLKAPMNVKEDIFEYALENFFVKTGYDHVADVLVMIESLSNNDFNEIVRENLDKIISLVQEDTANFSLKRNLSLLMLLNSADNNISLKVMDILSYYEGYYPSVSVDTHQHSRSLRGIIVDAVKKHVPDAELFHDYIVFIHGDEIGVHFNQTGDPTEPLLHKSLGNISGEILTKLQESKALSNLNVVIPAPGSPDEDKHLIVRSDIKVAGLTEFWRMIGTSDIMYDSSIATKPRT